MGNFNEAVKTVLRHEGGYVKDPVDRGGETFRGISRRFFPKWAGWALVDINHFDPRLDALVEEFYYEYFWAPLRLSEINDDFVAMMLFDISVNQGKKAVAKKMQRIVGVVQDGIIGPKTLAAVNSHHRDAFVFQFLMETIDLYTHIITKDRTQQRFIRGWLNRAMGLYHAFEHSKKTSA